MTKIHISEGDWINANNPGLMKIYKHEFPDAYREMIRQGRKRNPKVCAECPFFYHLIGRDGKAYGGGCTIDDDVMIMDQLERVADCPL